MLQGFEPSISEGMMLFMINKVFQEPPEERNLGLWGWWAILLTTQLGCGIWFSFRESFHYAFVKPDVHNEVQFHLTGNINLDLVCWVTGLHQIQVIFFFYLDSFLKTKKFSFSLIGIWLPKMSCQVNLPPPPPLPVHS